jgi:hypothetical protein
MSAVKALPQRLARASERIVALLACEVGHRRRQVHHSNSVAHRLLELPHRLTRLQVRPAVMIKIHRKLLHTEPLDLRLEVVRLGASLIDKIGGESHVTRLPRCSIKLHQRELDLFMPAITQDLVVSLPKRAIDQIGQLAHHAEQRLFSRRFEMSHPCFDEVTGDVQFVMLE